MEENSLGRLKMSVQMSGFESAIYRVKSAIYRVDAHKNKKCGIKNA